MIDPRRVRNDLLHATDSRVKHRRIVVGLSVLSSTILGGIALFQTGILKRLPEPQVPGLDAEAVNGSVEAYSKGGAPDALLGMASYAATGILAGTGAADRWREQPWLPLAMAGKVGLDAAMAGRLTAKSWTKFRKFSLWSLLVAAASAAAVPFVFSEAKQAAERLRTKL